jgi:hypothetical protein
MTPNIMKANKDTTKFTPEAPDSVKAQAHDAPGQTSAMDGDHTGKTLDNAATNTAVASDITESLHETAKQGVSFYLPFSSPYFPFCQIWSLL